LLLTFRGSCVERPPTPAPNPAYPTKQHLALRLLADFETHHPDIRVHRVHCITAESLYGIAPCVDAASTMFGGVQVLSHIRSHQNIRIGKRKQHVADYVATHPGTQKCVCIRGAEEMVAMVSRARLDVCSHKTKRFVVAITYAHEETYRSLIASDLSWRTLDMVQGYS
jgi:hypothetical protein